MSSCRRCGQFCQMINQIFNHVQTGLDVKITAWFDFEVKFNEKTVLIYYFFKFVVVSCPAEYSGSLSFPPLSAALLLLYIFSLSLLIDSIPPDTENKYNKNNLTQPSRQLEANAALRPDHIISPFLNKSQHGEQRGTVGITEAACISPQYNGCFTAIICHTSCKWDTCLTFYAYRALTCNN